MRYIHDIGDGIRLEMPFERIDGRVHFDEMVLVWRYNVDTQSDDFAWEPLREMLTEVEIEAIRKRAER